jgi:hypothetical protein
VQPPSTGTDDGEWIPDPGTSAAGDLLLGEGGDIAPSFLLLSSLALPSLASEPGDQIGLVSAQHGRYYVFVLFGIVGSIFMLPAMLAIMETVRASHRRLGVIGGGLALFGSTLALVDWGGELVKWQMGVPGVDRGQMVALVARFDEAAPSAAITQLSGLTFLIGIVVLAVGLHRGHIAPLWASLGLAVGTLMNLIGFAAGQIVLLDAGGAILLAAMASTAWHAYITAVAPRPASGQVTLGLHPS